MPTFDISDTFWRDWARLSPEQKGAFGVAVRRFVADLTAIEGDATQAVRPGLRVKRYQGQTGVMELTWAPDGRALFMYGDSIQPGRTHVRWLRVGAHDIL